MNAKLGYKRVNKDIDIVQDTFTTYLNPVFTEMQVKKRTAGFESFLSFALRGISCYFVPFKLGQKVGQPQQERNY